MSNQITSYSPKVVETNDEIDNFIAESKNHFAKVVTEHSYSEDLTNAIKHKVIVTRLKPKNKPYYTNKDLIKFIEEEFKRKVLKSFYGKYNTFVIYSDKVINATKIFKDAYRVRIVPMVNCTMAVVTNFDTSLEDDVIHEAMKVFGKSFDVLRNVNKTMVSVFFREVDPRATLVTELPGVKYNLIEEKHQVKWYQFYDDGRRPSWIERILVPFIPDDLKEAMKEHEGKEEIIEEPQEKKEQQEFKEGKNPAKKRTIKEADFHANSRKTSPINPGPELSRVEIVDVDMMQNCFRKGDKDKDKDRKKQRTNRRRHDQKNTLEQEKNQENILEQEDNNVFYTNDKPNPNNIFTNSDIQSESDTSDQPNNKDNEEVMDVEFEEDEEGVQHNESLKNLGESPPDNGDVHQNIQ